MIMEGKSEEKKEEITITNEVNQTDTFNSSTATIQNIIIKIGNDSEKIEIKKKRRRATTKNCEEKIDFSLIKKPLSPYILFCKEVD